VGKTKITKHNYMTDWDTQKYTEVVIVSSGFGYSFYSKRIEDDAWLSMCDSATIDTYVEDIEDIKHLNTLYEEMFNRKRSQKLERIING